MNTMQEAASAGATAGWLLVPEQIEKKGLLGKGSFGETYLALLRGQEVAVKCVRVNGDVETRTFLRELEAMTRISNPNVMGFYGAVLQPPQECWLVVEYLPGGTLKEWIHGKGGSVPKRSMAEKIKMGLGVAKGMQVLSTLEPPIIHRDLKPSNVMLSSEGLPKIADFGLARRHVLSEVDAYTGETGSYTYMSPEMMRGDKYGPPTDVFSFGILMAEIIKQQDPYEEYRLTPVQVATAVADNDLRPKLQHHHLTHHHAHQELQRLIEFCWAADPTARPSFPEIVTKMSSILGSL